MVVGGREAEVFTFFFTRSDDELFKALFRSGGPDNLILKHPLHRGTQNTGHQIMGFPGHNFMNKYQDYEH